MWPDIAEAPALVPPMQFQRAVHRFVDLGAADDGQQALLVAAGHEDAVGLFDGAHQLGLVGVGARTEVHMHAVRHAQVAEGLVVDLPHFVGDLAGGRDHDDLRVLAAGQFDEAAQDGLVVLAILAAADDDEVAVFAALVVHLPTFAWGMSRLLAAPISVRLTAIRPMSMSCSNRSTPRCSAVCSGMPSSIQR
jgi:hypothetical protein